jgi:hypothetical protein
MKDAYGNGMTAQLARAKELRIRLAELNAKRLRNQIEEEERIKLIFRIRILEDDGR